MTTTPKDGGPAFPCAETFRMEAWDGMKLRDYFAAQALAGMGMWIPPGDYLDDMGHPLQPYTNRYQRLIREARAEWAYAQADAMLAERGLQHDF